MIKRKTSALVIILMLVLQCAYGMGLSSEVKAAAIENDTDIITSVSMAVYGPDGQTVTGSVYEVDANVTLDYTWSLPNDHEYKSGDTFTFQLPQQFQLYNDVSGSLISDEGETGTFTVSQATHQVVMYFNDYIERHDNIQGTLRINTKFNKQTISGSTVQEILFPVAGGIQTVIVKFKPNVGSVIEKKGSPQGFNADHILWTVDVNKTQENVSNAVVTDPIPAGLSLPLPVTAAVYQLDIQLDGTALQGALIDASRYSAEVTDGVLTVRFHDAVINSAYRIEYITTITNDNQTSFTNTATFKGDGRIPADSSATVQVERGGSLKKFSNGYDSGKQTISWVIEYNYNNKTIPMGVLTDLFNDSQELISGSLKVYPVTLDSSGKGIKGIPLTEGADYVVTAATGDHQAGFKLQFTNEVTSPYRIEYQTKSSERVFSDTTITNTVTDSTYSEQADYLIRPVIAYKNLSGVDYQNKTLDWKITVNGDRYPMDKVVVTDTFPQGGMTFIPASLVVKNESGRVLSASEYTLDYVKPVQPNKGFKVTLHSAITGTYTIGYTTTYSNDWLTGSTDNFINNARVDWKDSSGADRWFEAKGLFIPRIEAKNNGYKSGSYNAAAKEITWTVGFNYNGKTIDSPELADFLKAGQVLVPGSLKVYNMNIAKNGDVSQGAEINNGKYVYNVDGSQQLKVKFKTAISEPYYVVFKTSLEGSLIGKKVDNTANLWDGTRKVSKDLNASVTIPYGEEYVFKDGAQNGEKIDWSIQINRGQSHVKDALIKDTPSPNQILLPDSFHLYPTSVAASGEVAKSGPELVKDKDYSLDIISDDEGKQTFSLTFLQDIKTAYVLEYQTLIVANNGDKVINAVEFSGNNVVLVHGDSSKEIIVGLSSGSGTGSGVRGSLTVQKLDADDHAKTLGGATFALYRVSGSERVLVQTVVTDTYGTAAFNKIWLGSYILRETVAPEGYVLDPTEYPVSIHSAATINLNVLNKKALATPAPTAQPTPTPTAVPTETPTETTTPTPTTTPVSTETPTETTTPTPTTTPVSTETPSGTISPTTPALTPSPQPEVVIDDSEIPAGPGIPAGQPSPAVDEGIQVPDTSGNDDTSSEDIEMEDEDIPAGPGIESADSQADSPAVDKLPKTGEQGPMPFYLAGIALILTGFLLSRRLGRSDRKD